MARVCGPNAPSAGAIPSAACSTFTVAPLAPGCSTTASYAAYLPVGRSASALSARQTGELTTPVAASFLAVW